mmetsp:Transcript_9437/g.15146  ORF Transcript_9437/g.15146 Transcript_9437/m.15146 type:complete len:503 (+) Transcript_9437:23-1531(+)
MSSAASEVGVVDESQSSIQTAMQRGSSDGESKELIHFAEGRSNRTIDSFLDDLPLTWHQWSIVLTLGIANSSDAVEIISMSYIIADDSFESMLPGDDSGREAQAGFLTAAVYFGMLVGGLLVGFSGDELGRKYTLLLCLACVTIAGVFSSFMPSIALLTLMRCLCGVGVGGTVPSIFTLGVELMPQKRRGYFITVIAFFWVVGALYSAVTAIVLFSYLRLSWRIYALVSAFPAAFGFFLVTLIPKSPRFLGMRNNYDEAARIVNRMARKTGYQGEPMEVAEIRGQFARDVARSGGSTFAVVRKAIGLLYSPNFYGTTVGLQLTWFGMSFGTYGLITWITTLFKEVGLHDPYLCALIFNASQIPGNLFATFMVDSLGRRSILTGGVLLSIASLGLFAFTLKGGSAAYVVTAASIFQACSTTSWAVLGCLSSEVYPTELRSTGTGLLAACGRVGAMVAQFVNSALLKSPVMLLLVTMSMLSFGLLGPYATGNRDFTNRPLGDRV